MKQSRNKCIWSACIAAVALCIALTYVHAAGNLGSAYISNVVGANGECAVNTTTGQSHKWDIQAGGTYNITLSGVTDCASQGNENTIGIIVHNGTGGNISTTATLVDPNVPGVYRFQVALGNQCLTMPIEYCTVNGQTGSGKFAQGYNDTAGDGHLGHLRTATFGANCSVTGEDTTCQHACTGSITACKYFHFDTNNSVGSSEQGLANWPFCLTSLTDPDFSPVQQSTSQGGCATFSGLPPGSYVVTEGSASNYFASTDTSQIVVVKCDQTVTVKFGNFCTVASGGRTLGFWSNKNGQAILTGSQNGTSLLASPQSLLRTLNLRNANGTYFYTGTNSAPGNQTVTYSAFRTWLLGATATNMAYMLSAQLAALALDVQAGFVDGNAYDLCSSMTVNQLIGAAQTSLASFGNTPSGNAQRQAQELLKSCMDAINNNGQVVPATPCNYSASVECSQ